MAVALTFDDGPDPEHTPRILDLLGERGIRATFFVFGVKARRNRELIARALEAGHEVQPHCWADHDSHLRMSEQEIEVEIERTVKTLTHLGCPPPTLWRPPYGDIREPETHTVAARHGLEVVTWTLDTLDWDPDGSALSLDEVDAAARARLGRADARPDPPHGGAARGPARPPRRTRLRGRADGRVGEQAECLLAR